MNKVSLHIWAMHLKPYMSLYHTIGHTTNQNTGKLFYTRHIYGLLSKYEVKMAGYWPSSFFAC